MYTIILGLHDRSRQIQRCSQVVALVDNASFHKTAFSIGAMQHSGLEVLFVPPYTPEANNIEMIFGLIKRALLKLVVMDILGLINAVQAILRNLPPETLRKAFAQSYRDVVNMVNFN